MATRKPKAAKPSIRTKALHHKAQRYNWDDGLQNLEEILENRACDHGTALLIYWMGGPGYFRRYRTIADAQVFERPLVRFLRKLEKAAPDA